MKKFGFYFFTFCVLVIAIGLGALLGVYVFLKLISKNVTKKDLEDRENQIIQEAQKKKNKQHSNQALGDYSRTSTTTKLDEVSEVARKIKNKEYDQIGIQRAILREFRTPCNRRFRINYLGYFWIPPEFHEDWQDVDILEQSDFNIHQFIRNLYK
ncbi:MAG: hypothetical protein ACOVQ4_05275 [Flectobacillus sp.]|uniref:hypothetical protein n=1 Tax=Flectobacillus sp. TaxID=50419 RepID=UPI003B9D26A5